MGANAPRLHPITIGIPGEPGWTLYVDCGEAQVSYIEENLNRYYRAGSWAISARERLVDLLEALTASDPDSPAAPPHGPSDPQPSQAGSPPPARP